MMHASPGQSETALITEDIDVAGPTQRLYRRGLLNPERQLGWVGCSKLESSGPEAMANSLRRLAMAAMVMAVALMGGSGPGVARADDYIGFGPSYLNEGDSMTEGWILGGGADYIENRYGLHLQLDCNLVLYPHGQFDKPLWASNTAGRAQHCTLVMQTDCNAVLYETGTQNALWASQTAGKGDGCSIEVQLDGNVVVYDGNRVALWSTNTVQS